MKNMDSSTVCRQALMCLLLLTAAPAVTPGGGVCRCRDVYLPVQLFAQHSCALCYDYHPTLNIRRGAPVDRLMLETSAVSVYGVTYAVSHLTNGTHTILADPDRDPDPALLATLPVQIDIDMWRECCYSAQRCCNTTLQADRAHNGTWCPATWDGWQCWEPTPPGKEARAACPHYVYFRTTPSCQRFASKQCEPSGQWLTVQVGNSTIERSDYLSCSQVQTLTTRLYVHLSANAISIAFLVPALIILLSFKQLNVHRINIHKNFFASLLLHSTMAITFNVVVVMDELNAEEGLSFMDQNGWGCRLLFLLTKYTRLTNYMWQFCESFYLHKLIASAFAEQRSLIVFYFTGWGLPLVPVGVYAGLRVAYADIDCWVAPEEQLEWVLYVPCLVSLIICTIFLVNIIRVLLTKLRAPHSNEPRQYRKAVRATLVLVPLFGLHLMVTIYRPTGGPCIWIELYHYTDYMLDGLQGAIIATIFCYLNGEVQCLLRRCYGRYWDMWPARYRDIHRESRLSARSQNTLHTLVTTNSISHPANTTVVEHPLIPNTETQL